MKILVECRSATPKGAILDRTTHTKFWSKEFDDECKAEQWAAEQFAKDAVEVKVSKTK